MSTLISACGIIIIFFSLGAFLRYGQEAKDMVLLETVFQTCLNKSRFNI